MTTATLAPAGFKARIAGWVIGGLPAAFLIFDGALKLFPPAVVIEESAKLGYDESKLFGLGLVLLVSTVLYLVPRTAVLGAILLTGYLGGAVATHVAAGDGWFPILFPVAFGALLWGGLYLRDHRVRSLVPLRS